MATHKVILCTGGNQGLGYGILEVAGPPRALFCLHFSLPYCYIHTWLFEASIN